MKKLILFIAVMMIVSCAGWQIKASASYTDKKGNTYDCSVETDGKTGTCSLSIDSGKKKFTCSLEGKIVDCGADLERYLPLIK